MSRLALVSAVIAVGAACVAQPGASSSITGRVLVNPLAVAVVGPTDPVKAGRRFDIVAAVSNAGTAAVRDVDVTLVRDPAVILYDPPAQRIDRIGPGVKKKVAWDACSATPGSYVLLVRATSGPFTAESPGVVLTVVGSRPAKC